MENGEWRHGLFSGVCGADSCSMCLGAWFCSCFLHGRTAERLDNFPSAETPELFNGPCALFCAAGCCSLNWLVALFKRGDVRAKFGIRGDGCTDCLASCFCTPCALAQMETEVKDRAKEALLGGGMSQYSQTQGKMSYQQPQQGHYQSPPPVHQQNGHVDQHQGPPKY